MRLSRTQIVLFLATACALAGILYYLSARDDQATPVKDADRLSAVLATAADANSARTRSDVLERFGPPRQMDATGSRWTYDEQVIIFRDDQVIGWITPMPEKSEPDPSSSATATPRPPQRLSYVSPPWDDDGAYVIYGLETERHQSRRGPRLYTAAEKHRWYNTRRGYDSRAGRNNRRFTETRTSWTLYAGRRAYSRF